VCMYVSTYVLRAYVHIHTHTYIHIYTYVYIYPYAEQDANLRPHFSDDPIGYVSYTALLLCMFDWLTKFLECKTVCVKQ
jgi:hypothetical protein